MCKQRTAVKKRWKAAIRYASVYIVFRCLKSAVRNFFTSWLRILISFENVYVSLEMINVGLLI